MSKYIIVLNSSSGNWSYEVRKKNWFGSEYIASFTFEQKAEEFIEERIRLEKKYS